MISGLHEMIGCFRKAHALLSKVFRRLELKRNGPKTVSVLPRCCPCNKPVKREKNAHGLDIDFNCLLARPKRFELLTPRFVV